MPYESVDDVIDWEVDENLENLEFDEIDMEFTYASN